IAGPGSRLHCNGRRAVPAHPLRAGVADRADRGAAGYHRAGLRRRRGAAAAWRPALGARRRAGSEGGLTVPETKLLGLLLADMDAVTAAAALASRAAEAPFAYVMTPNADNFVRVSRDPALRGIYQRAVIRLLDSRVVARAARLLALSPPAVAPGSDLTAELLRHHLIPGERVAIIGLRPAYLPPLIAACGIAPPFHHDPPMGFERDPAAVRAAVELVLAHPARFVFLAVG